MITYCQIKHHHEGKLEVVTNNENMKMNQTPSCMYPGFLLLHDEPKDDDSHTDGNKDYAIQHTLN